MSTNYFQGKDGFVWWNGVVEDRKDPLMIGRCRVRILGWHTADKAELPTAYLPWAYPVMPITSGSQTNAGDAPVGPVEGTWVMGYYRDGELAQEPVMIGTMPGIPENLAKQNTGFNDPRLDVQNVDRQQRPPVEPPTTSLMGWPYPPKGLEFSAGQEVQITEFTNEQRQAEVGKSLYPRYTNKPTTSIYARGVSDSSTGLPDAGIIGSKNSNLDSGTIKTKFTPSEKLLTRLSETATTEVDSTFFTIDSETKIEQPPSAYSAAYPFNHVYESESGHLVEIDDTPTKERLHWYHRSGTFTEFHPKGNRVDAVRGTHYHMVTGNLESITSGQEKKIVRNDSFSKYVKSKFETISDDMIVTSSNGDIILGAPAGTTLISGGNVLIDASNTLVLDAGQIIRSDDAASDVIKGSYKATAQGEYSLNAGKMTLGSMGATNISSFGAMSQTVGGSSEEIISNLDVILGNTNAKLIKAMLGKIVLETFDGILTGVIDLNVGPMGAMGQIAINAPLGDIDIKSNTGPTGINIQATTIAKLKGLVQAAVEGALVGIKADALCQIDGALITVGGQTEPMILGKTFLMDVFKDHQHPSSVGPTGPIMPQYAAKILQAMSKKCFLG